MTRAATKAKPKAKPATRTVPAETFDPYELADRKIRIIRLFKNTKGDFAGKPFNLQPWQCDDILRPLFRTDRNGKRIVRESFIFMPRKNGKSEIIAAIALDHLLFDEEKGKEVILGASDRDQASIVFRACEEMVRQDPNLLKRCKPLPATKTLAIPGTNHFLRAIPSDEGGAHGLNPSLAIGDELHAWRGRGLYDAIRTGQGARSSPLFINITTAGFDKHSICYERYSYAKRVLAGTVKDPTFLPVIFEAGDNEPWDEEKIWRKANPGLRGATPFRSIDEMRRMCAEAKEIPALQNAFRRLYLNQWTEQDVRWIDKSAWAKCGGECDPFEGRACFSALDLSSTTDLSALVHLFPPTGDGTRWDILCRFYVPEDGARRRAARDKVPYLEWIKQGHITATPGNVIDYDRIKLDLQEDAERFRITQIAIDRWNATQLTTQLTGAGFDVVPFGQGFASMAGPSKEFEKKVLGKSYRSGDNPVLDWCVGNVAVEQDAAGNIKPSKKKSTERIDGVVALVMATGLATAAKPSESSAYDQPGGGVISLDDD